jgi:hypothetical protein
VTSPDAPIPAGTLCTLAGVKVRVYATIWPGVAWDGRYRLFRLGERQSCGMATRDELVVTGELRRETIGPRTAWRALAPYLLAAGAGLVASPGLEWAIARWL